MFPFRRLLQLLQRNFDLGLLLLNQIRLHRILIVGIAHEFRQLLLLLQQWSRHLWALTPPLLSRGLLVSSVKIDIVLRFLSVLPLVSRVINPQYPSHDFCSSEIIHRQVRTSLIFIFEKTEAFAFPALLVAHEIDVDGFAVLAEDSDDVAFGEVERESANVNVGCVAVVGVPGRFWRAGERLVLVEVAVQNEN